MKKKLVFVLMVVSAVSGCAGKWPSTWSSLWPFSRTQEFQMPGVHFQDIRVVSAGLTGGVLDVVISVNNINQTEVAVPRLTYRLMVDSATIGEGIHADSMLIAKADSVIIRFPVELDYDALTEAARQLMVRGAVNYTIAGDITVNAPTGVVTQPYTQTGQFTTFEGVRR